MRNLLLTCILLLTLGMTCAAAEETGPAVYTTGNWQYVLLEDNTAEIYSYRVVGADPFKTERTALTIPAELDGYQVTGIGEHAFDYYLPLSITIPDSVASINSFGGRAASFDIIVSPDHPALAMIDGVLFEETEKRLVCYTAAFASDSYAIPQGIRSIGDQAFLDCKALTCITIPDSVASIGDMAFSGCRSLTSITIPDSVTAIGTEAFAGCTSLAGITLPNSVVSIGNMAFSGCRSLTSITIPDSVTTIGTNPFDSCLNLAEIVISPDQPVLATIHGVLFEKTAKRLVWYPRSSAAQSYVIPQGIRSIDEGAFSNCSALTSITIPDSVTFIGNAAFSGCSNLASVTVPDSVAFIGDAAFSGCSSLASITIPHSVTSIGRSAFQNCKALTDVIIPEGVTSIGASAFKNCKALTSVTLPRSVTCIETRPFSGCPATLTITVDRDSYAAGWCRESGLNYTYTDSLDWLTN